jgi:CBS domain-containing protein
MKTCGEIMTKDLTCCLPNEMVSKVAQMMKKANIGSIPVIEDEHSKKLIGIVTDRDLTVKVVAEDRDAKTTKVNAVMTHNVITCHPEDNLQVALDLMSKNQLRRLPVLDKDNKLVGIIAQADVATRGNEPEETAAMVKGISRSAKK